MDSHASNETWELVDLPPGAKTIGCGLVFQLKCNADGSIEQYKARLVTKGYSQCPGFDYTEVFAPTFCYAAIWTIIMLAAVNDLHLCSVNISHAFLNGDLEETIYMHQAEGFHSGSSNKVYLLQKSLYGLKQAARQWNKKLHNALASMGFKQLDSDCSIYIFLCGDVHIIIIDALECFNMSDCNPIGTPMDPEVQLSSSMSPQSPEEPKITDKIPYLSAVGTLQYLATSTCPDISFTVGVLACFNSNPGIQHWNAFKHLFYYLKGTLDYKLVYGPTDCWIM